MTRNFVRRWFGKLANKNASSERADALASLHQSLADFQEAVDRAQAVGYTAYDQKFLDSVLAQFASIKEEIPTSRPADLEKLVQDAKSLSRLRAFVYPPSELEFLAKTALDEMTTWLVPTAVLDAMRTHLLSVFGKEGATRTEAERRAALCILFDYYDYWDRYVDDEFTPFMRTVGGGCCSLRLASPR